MYEIRLNAEKRMVAAFYTQNKKPGAIIIEKLPGRPLDDYKLIDGKIVHDPRSDRPKFDPNAPTEMQILKGIVSALAMVTGHAEVLKNGKF